MGGENNQRKMRRGPLAGLLELSPRPTGMPATRLSRAVLRKRDIDVESTTSSMPLSRWRGLEISRGSKENIQRGEDGEYHSFARWLTRIIYNVCSVSRRCLPSGRWWNIGSVERHAYGQTRLRIVSDMAGGRSFLDMLFHLAQRDDVSLLGCPRVCFASLE
jgi:hypothetical protein